MRMALGVSYLGQRYQGWQSQPSGQTVQDRLEAALAQFATHPDFLLLIAPEGTRRLTEGWKSGFYHIAKTAGVPLILTTVDYARREIGVLAHLELSDDPQADIAAIAAIYAGRQGRNPALASPVRWRD